jgi:hypothetical protein
MKNCLIFHKEWMCNHCIETNKVETSTRINNLQQFVEKEHRDSKKIMNLSNMKRWNKHLMFPISWNVNNNIV